MRFIQLLLVIAVNTQLYAQKQSLFESGEYRKAYENATRSRSGVPGENYWQNNSNYEIEAKFYPISRIIEGHLKVTYFNQSPDSLNIIVFKLMQNVYKKGAKRQMSIDLVNLHDGIKISNVTFNGAVLAEKSISINGTLMRLSLPKFMSKKSSIIIEMDFETPIPKTSGYRSGSIDSTSFFAAYWFPQVAVYDDIFGWDTDEYVGIPENYNDFSTYDVALTLPSEFNIWATGELINAHKIFSAEIISRIANSKISTKPITILSEEDFRDADGAYHTWRFKAENVPDFAWGASDHYIWEGVAANNPDSGNLCWVQSAYPKGANHFDWVIDVAKKSVEIFSNDFPGIAYPYFKHISFRGTQGGGMEFPMLANNNVAYDSVNTIMVTAHELAHNYFPFMMGINERKYGWWDETMTTLMESYLTKKAFPNQQIQGFFNRKISFNFLAPLHDMLPLITETSNIMKELPTITNFYIKGPAAMDILANLIGSNEFYAYTKEFMILWAGKHPTPYDFFYFINDKEGRNLNWFWNSWLFSYGYPDLAINNAEQNGNYLKVVIKNVGGLPVPFNLIITEKESGFEETFNVANWENNLEEITVRIPIKENVVSVSIDNRYSYDADPANNEFNFK